MNEQAINLRDIHLPEPVSWWPVAPGWWLLTAALLIMLILFIIAKKFYMSRQLNRDISTELEKIKQQFQKTQNKSQLAKALSVLLRRASISYYSQNNPAGAAVAGLTGDSWLAWLDKTCHKKPPPKSAENKFQSDIGRVLITAPYLAADNNINYDALALIQLCESWLLSSHTASKPS